MEPRKQVASPSPEKVSSSTGYFPAPPQTRPIKYSPASSPDGSSPLISHGGPVQMTVDAHPNMCSSPSFGLYTSNASQSEFGGLGSLGLSTLAAQSQVNNFQEWWQPVGTNTNKSTAFFPPFLCLHPVFLSTFKSLYSVGEQSQTVCVGVNDRGVSPPTMNSAANHSSFPAEEKKEKTKPNSSRRQKTIHESLQSHQKAIPKKTKKRLKLIKSSSEISSTSGCLSGSWSGSSSDGEGTSRDPDRVEDDDNDPNTVSADPKNKSPVKRKRLTHTSQSKRKRPHAADGNFTQGSLCNSVPVTSSFQPQPFSHQSTALGLQRAPATQEEGQQHISVIQPTGLSHRQACPSSYKSSPDPYSSKYMPRLTSPKPLPFTSLPNQSSSYLKSLALCSPKKPSSLCSLPNQPPPGSFKPFSHSSSTSHVLSASVESSHELSLLTPPKKCTRPVSSLKESCGSFQHESFLQPNSFELKKDSVKQASSVQQNNQSDTNLFLNLNGASHSAVQDAPLALVTQRSSQRSSPNSKSLFESARASDLTPINLSTGNKKTSNCSSSSLKCSASSGCVPVSGKAAMVLHERRGLTKPNSHSPHVDSTRNDESEFSSSKDSDESFEDDEDESEDEDSSDSSLSDSESNLESDGSEAHIKERVETEADGDADKPVLKSPEPSASTLDCSSLNCSPNCSLLNQKITEPLVLSCKCLLNPVVNAEPLNKRDDLSSSVTFKKTPVRRRNITDERTLQIPLKFGWQRETWIRTIAGRLQGNVAYFAPCGRRLSKFPDIMKYLIRNGITELSRENFSFSTKIKVGNFYEVQEGPEGLQWFLLAEDEIASRIVAMVGRRNHSKRSELQSTPKVPGVRYLHPVGENNLQYTNDAKLMRKLKAQAGIAQQAAQIKLMRKLEKQAMVQAAKEAKKQQALMAAEERWKKREEIKRIKQQEKIKRIQHIRLEKELRAQQVLEEKRKKKEAAANAKLLEAEKRTKEKEVRRLHAAILKQEKERRRQHMMLLKAVEAQKKAEEKERLKQEKRDKIRLNKEKKRMELEKAKELRKPKEDMCLTDHKPLPELSCMPGLILPRKTISDCLMVLQFLHNFGDVLKLGLNSDMLTISNLQEGLLNIGDSTMHNVQDMLVSMLSAAVCDPGLPAGRKCKTVFGDHLSNVKINRDNASEVLQIYMENHPEETQLASVAASLKTKAFQAHSPSQKAAVLAFLVNELCCSKAVISEIDKTIDHMTSLRKDKWIIEGKLRKLRDIHARTVGKKDNGVGSENNYNFKCSSFKNQCSRKERDSEEEEEYENDSEDQGHGNDYDEEEEEEPGRNKRRSTEFCEEDGVHSNSVEELEKQIEDMCRLRSQISQELFDSSHSLRSTIIGEDRYKRRYWVLPHCGAIFVEGCEEEEKEEKSERIPQGIGVEEEQQEEEMKPEVFLPVQSSNCDNILPQCPQNNSSLYPQSLGELPAEDKMVQGLDLNVQNIPSTNSKSSPSPPTSQTDTFKSSELKQCNGTYSPQSVLYCNGLSKILTEKPSVWFSLLPRSPCDGPSVALSSSSPASSSCSKPFFIKRCSFIYPKPPASANHSTTAGISSQQVPNPHQVESDIHQSRQTLSSSATSSTSPVSDTSLPPMLDLSSQQAEANGNRDLCLAQNRSINESETTDLLKEEKPLCASSPDENLATIQDYPQPIPEEMLHGWWRVADMENLQSLLKTLHCRGIRERVLQKQIQKHLEHISQLFAKSKNELDVTEPEMCELRKKRVESWCVEEQAMEVDVHLLRHVEALEKKVISANLQVKGWMPREPQSDSHLVYYEHKPSSSSAFQNKGPRETSQKESSVCLSRRTNNPLDIAVTRFAELERNIEQSCKQEVVPGIKLLRKTLGQVCSSAQLWLCIQQLQKTITWKRTVMKKHCQLCQKGDNEELLLLCNGCDKGCHTYCHNPKITTVPEGDWFCSFCVAKENGQLPHSRKQQSRTAGGGKRCGEENRNRKPSVAGEHISEEVASSNNVPKRGTREFKKRRGDGSDVKCDSSVSCAKTSKDSCGELAMCRLLLSELEDHQDAWPFLTPVDHKAVPGYKKIIKKPMDFSTIKKKLLNNLYLNLGGFVVDVNLVFDNCVKFNEDDSEIGRAGHRMRTFFDKRRTELLQ